MLTRLNVRDREQPEAARRRFDGQLSVKAWATPAQDRVDPDPINPGAAKDPWWWDGAEEASQSFLTAMGVKLE